VEFAEVNQLVSSDPWLHDDSHAKLNSVLAIGDGATCIDGPNCEPKAVKELLRLDKAHTQSTGLGVRVAVLDTGTDWNHPLLRRWISGRSTTSSTTTPMRWKAARRSPTSQTSASPASAMARTWQASFTASLPMRS
jgi:hypothetical protein